jgi:hypothetical protein
MARTSKPVAQARHEAVFDDAGQQTLALERFGWAIAAR